MSFFATVCQLSEQQHLQLPATREDAAMLTAEELRARRTHLEGKRDKVTKEAATLRLRLIGGTSEPAILPLYTAKLATIAAIDRAVTRIESGSYGTCRRCRHPIAIERLERMPDAEYCVVCADATP